MTALFFERPYLLTVILLGIQVILVWVWARVGGRAAVWAVWSGFLATPILFFLSLSVVTPREQVQSLCRKLEKCIDDGDMVAMGALLAPEFEAGGLNRGEFLRRVEAALTRYHVNQTRLDRIEVTLSGRAGGEADLIASGRVWGNGESWDRLVTRWRVSCRLENEWLVTTLKPVPIPPLYIRDLRHVLD
jgi:hypothetical protein